MAEQRLFKCLAAIPASAGNLLNGAITSLTGPVGFSYTQPRIILRHIRIVNKSANAVAVSLWVGATGGSAAGTEFAFGAESIPANSHADWYGEFVMDSTDFLTGLAGTVTTLVANIEFEVGFS